METIMLTIGVPVAVWLLFRLVIAIGIEFGRR
jgi:hypothetical protein